MLLDDLMTLTLKTPQSQLIQKAEEYAFSYHATQDKRYAWLYHWANYCAGYPLDEDIPGVKRLWDGFIQMQDPRLMVIVRQFAFCRDYGITPEILRRDVIPYLHDEVLTYQMLEHIGLNFRSPYFLEKSFEGTCLIDRVRMICQLHEDGLIDRATWTRMIKESGTSTSQEEVDIYLE